MAETVRTICDACYNEVDAPVIAVRETVDVRGVPITDEFWYPVCPLCGNRIGHAATMDRNFEKMYACLLYTSIARALADEFGIARNVAYDLALKA